MYLNDFQHFIYHSQLRTTACSTCLTVNQAGGISITSFIKFSFPGDDFPQFKTVITGSGIISSFGIF